LTLFQISRRTLKLLCRQRLVLCKWLEVLKMIGVSTSCHLRNLSKLIVCWPNKFVPFPWTIPWTLFIVELIFINVHKHFQNLNAQSRMLDIFMHIPTMLNIFFTLICNPKILKICWATKVLNVRKLWFMRFQTCEIANTFILFML